MKKTIHPEYHDTEVNCVCGHKFSYGSSYQKDKLNVEVCNKCHPFYTGKQKHLDAAGRVERFQQKYKMPNFTSNK